MPQRIEVNVSTGEQTVIDLTPEEIADAEARTAQELAGREAKAPSPDEVFKAAVTKKLGLTDADLTQAAVTITASAVQLKG